MNTGSVKTNNPFNTAVEIYHGRSGELREYCDARDLHEALNVTIRFDKWINKRIDEYGFIEGRDFWPILDKS